VNDHHRANGLDRVQRAILAPAHLDIRSLLNELSEPISKNHNPHLGRTAHRGRAGLKGRLNLAIPNGTSGRRTHKSSLRKPFILGCRKSLSPRALSHPQIACQNLATF
jgi:hypothetical protein